MPHWNYLLIVKMLSVTLVSDPKAATFIMEMQTGSCLWFFKIIPTVACFPYIWRIFFPAANEGPRLKKIYQSQRSSLRRISVGIFKISTGNQSCEWNDKSANRERESRTRIGSDATFFWDSLSNLVIDDNFRISNNLGLGLAANISTALAIQPDRDREIEII
jgi:hypothetical protein